LGGGPVDVRGLLAEAEKAGGPWAGMPAGATVGHVHLQVGDVAEAERFYHRVLGFDVVAGGETSLFVSAGGYHHHLGLNTWHSRGASPAPADTARLRFYSVRLPSEEARAAVLARVEAAGLTTREVGGAVVVDDPWGHAVVLDVGTGPEVERVAGLAAAL
jgi:catechol 2,3-dioxygenase